MEPPLVEPPSRLAERGATGRGWSEPAPPEPEPPRQSAGSADRNSAPRGRVEPLLEPPSRQAATADRSGNGMLRGRGDAPPEPSPPAVDREGRRPGASDRSASSRGLYEQPSPPAGPDAARIAGDGKAAPNDKTSGGDGGGWLSNLLTRASREGDDQGDRNAAAKPARPEPPQAPPPVGGDDLRLGIDSVDSLLVDVTRMIDNDAAAELWQRHSRGERTTNVLRRLYTAPQGRKAYEEMRKRYKSDPDIRQAVDRYIAGFEGVLDDVDVATEAGKIYTLLAHSAGRFE